MFLGKIRLKTRFTIGESHAISHANVTEQQTQERRIQQPAVNPRRGNLTPKLNPLERERRLESQREQRRRRRQQQTAEQREHHSMNLEC